MKPTKYPPRRVTLGIIITGAAVLATSLSLPVQGADSTNRTIIIAPGEPQLYPAPSAFLFQNPDGYLAAWSVQGTELSSAEFLNPSQTGDLNWKAVGMGDFDGDAKPDILFEHTDGTLAVWHMNGTEMAQSSLLQPSHPGLGWRVAAVADFDQNGGADPVFQHTDGRVAIWFMKGTQLAVPALINSNQQADPRWRVELAADFNQDAVPDMMLQHTEGSVGIWYVSSLLPGMARSTVSESTDGTAQIWFLNGIIAKSEQLPYSVDEGWSVVGAKDFSGDGHTDLLFQHTEGYMAAWSMKGSILQSSALCRPSHPGAGWRVVGVTDQLSGVRLSSQTGSSSTAAQ